MNNLFADMDYHGISPRFRRAILVYNLLYYLVGLVLAGWGYLMLFAENASFSLMQWIYAVGLGVLWLGGLIFSMSVINKVYRFRGYALRGDAFFYRSGIVFPSVQSVALRKVQSVELVQNPITKWLKLYKLCIVTGAQSLNSIEVEGLPMEEAKELQALLLEKSNVKL